MIPAWQSVGRHRYFVEGNLHGMELHGPVALSQITEMLLPQEALLAQYERVLTFCDARDAQLPSAEVRQFLAERGKRVDSQRLSAVVVTSSTLLRTILQLIERATKIISGSTVRSTYVASEAEAWQWVEDQRRQPPQRASRARNQAPPTT